MTPGTYRFKIGEIDSFVLFDAMQIHSAEALIARPSREEIERDFASNTHNLDDIPVGYNVLLLKNADHHIMVDSGIRAPLGNLRVGLTTLEINPGDIQQIVITHSDRDHIGGILDEDGEFTYPNAWYIMLEDCWSHWSTKEEREKLRRLNGWTEDKMEFIWNTFNKISDRIELVNPGEQFFPGIQLLPAQGHRQDHSILVVSSSGENFFHLSDAFTHPLFIAFPEWVSNYDSNPQQSLETKLKLLEQCSTENALIFGAHFPFPGLGTIRKDRDQWLWVPVNMYLD